MQPKNAPYPSTRDSGLPWLGHIPAHWEVLRIKYSTYVKARVGWQGLASDEFTEEGPYLVTGTDFVDGRINWQSCYHVREERYAQDPYIMLKEGDLLITKDGTIGKVAIVRDLSEKSTLNSGVFVTRPLKNLYTTRYLYWVLSSDVFISFIDYIKSGTTINHLYQNAFVNFSFATPSIKEQEASAAFLDRQTAKIDALIAKKQRLLSLLAEQRAALISQAVTKGLNPDAKMKDSGVAWLGQVPEHWEVTKVKRKSKRIQTGSTPPTGQEKYYQSEDIPWFGPGSFSDDLVLSNPTKVLSRKGLQDGVMRLFDAGSTMIVTIGATIGKVGYLDQEGSSNQQITAITFKKEKLFPKFGAYQLKRLEKVIRAIAPSTTLPIIDQQEVGYLPFAVPPKEEQIQIVNYIDQQTKRLDDLATKVETAIERLREYRLALISSAVTGKIQVNTE